MNVEHHTDPCPPDLAACPACAVAWHNPATGLFHARCDGCEARAIAGSPAAWKALHARTGVEVQEAIERVFGIERYEAGRALVWQWINRAAALKREHTPC